MPADITPLRDKTPPQNGLLMALPPEDLRHLRPQLEPVALAPRKILFEADELLTPVYLIETGVVSLMTVFEDGTTVEMASIGREGLVGVETLLGGDVALGCYVVQAPGSALILEAARFRSALRESPKLGMACETYAQAFVAQLLQNVACNAAHTVERRCARRLLTSHDRSEGDSFTLTQELLAEILGVRRSTVTLVDRALQRAGLIRYQRGTITVLDRPGLEAAACECYRMIRERHERLLPPTLG